MIALGEGKASGNLAICEIVYFHLAEGILVNGVIHPDRLDLVGRMGGDYYARASGKAIFRVEKPVGAECLGYEGLPAFIKKSHIFSANNLARFANSKTIPTKEAVRKFLEEFRALPEEDVSEADFLRCLRQQDYSTMLRITQALAKEKHPKVRTFAEYTAKCALENNNLDFAWMAALYSEMIA
jgi:predicted ATP-dependent serine protease